MSISNILTDQSHEKLQTNTTNKKVPNSSHFQTVLHKCQIILQLFLYL